MLCTWTRSDDLFKETATMNKFVESIHAYRYTSETRRPWALQDEYRIMTVPFDLKIQHDPEEVVNKRDVRPAGSENLA